MATITMDNRSSGWCLLCANPFLPDDDEKGIDTGKLDRRHFFAEVVFVLHKLLQIPLLEVVSNFMVSEDAKDSLMKLCLDCSQLVEEGKGLLGEIERLQIRFQAVQATVQNKVFIAPHIGEKDERADVRELIKEHTRISLAYASNPINVGDCSNEVLTATTTEIAGTEMGEGNDTLEAAKEEKEVIDLVESDDEGNGFIKFRSLDDIVAEEFTNFEQALSGYSSDSLSNDSMGPVAKRFRHSLDSPLSEGSGPSSSPVLMNHLLHGKNFGSGGDQVPNLNLGVAEPQQRTSAVSHIRFAGHSWAPVWQGTLQCSLPHQEDPANLRCRMYSNLVNSTPFVSSEGWPSSFCLQAVSKQVMKAMHKYLKDSKFTVITFDKESTNEACMLREKLGQNGTSNGYVGLIRFRGAVSPCTEKIMVVLYVQSKGIFCGAIPNNQEVFAIELTKLFLAFKYRQQLQAVPAQIHHKDHDDNGSVLTIVPIGTSTVHHVATVPVQQQTSSNSIFTVQSQQQMANGHFAVQQQLGVQAQSASVIQSAINTPGFQFQ